MQQLDTTDCVLVYVITLEGMTLPGKHCGTSRTVICSFVDWSQEGLHAKRLVQVGPFWEGRRGTSPQRTSSVKEKCVNWIVWEGCVLRKTTRPFWEGWASLCMRGDPRIPMQALTMCKSRVWHFFPHWVSIWTQWQFYTVPGAQNVDSITVPANVGQL